MAPPNGLESLFPVEEVLRCRWWTGLLDMMNDGLAIVDAEARILYANPGFARLVGRLADELPDLPLAEVAAGLDAVGALRTGRPLADGRAWLPGTGTVVRVSVTPLPGEGRARAAALILRESREEKDVNRQEGGRIASGRSGKGTRSQAGEAWQAGELVFRSAAMQNLTGLALRLARVDSHVLINGESGVGKELFARLIHRTSSRSGGPLVVINCGAIPEPLLESELLGYESGAFTGARSEGKQGLLELADSGTLLLDEVAELPLSLQVKLLRVIQEQQFRRVGGTRLRKVNVRFLAATNRNLKELVAHKLFREDLYYRLNVTSLCIPPLRERREDIEPLAEHYLEHYNARYGLGKSFHPGVMRLFRSFSWPGNVRELQHLVERLVVSTPIDLITRDEQVLLEYFSDQVREKLVMISGILPLKEAQEQLERQLIAEAIRRQGSIRKAAPELGIDHSTLIRKMKKYGLEPQIGTG